MTKRIETERLQESVREIWLEDDVPGVVVGITHEGRRAVAVSGTTSIDNPLPVTEQTLFQVGSITKTFTCLALLQLVERGALSLDVPLRSYLPEFRVVDELCSQQVTARHLLTHTSGWEGDFFINTGRGADALAMYMAQMSELEQVVPPGELFSYNNAAFCLAGYLIERLSGLSFELVVEKYVLSPLGLDHTYFEASDVMTHRFAAGHIMTPERREVARPWALPRCSFPAGGVITNVGDLLTYAEFYLGLAGMAGGDKPLLSPDLLSAMQTPQCWITSGSQAIGLSWFIDAWNGERVLSHQGSTNGQVASLFLVPGRNFAVAALTNSNRGGSFTRRMTRWAMHHTLDIKPAAPTPVELSEVELQAYAGHYGRPFAEVEITVADHKLCAQVRYKLGFPAREDAPPPDPAPTLFTACNKDRFFEEGDSGASQELSFFRDADGRVAFLRAMNRLHARSA